MGDRGSIVVGWLAKLVMLFAVLGLLAYDGVKIMVANFGAADDAAYAAGVAADTFASTKDVRAAYAAAVKVVEGKGDTIPPASFEVDAAGKVTLMVDRSPTTLWMKHVGPLKKWTVVHQNGSGSAPQ